MLPAVKLQNLNSAKQRFKCIQKNWFLAGMFAAALIYFLFAIFCDSNLDSWRYDRFNFFHKNYSNDASIRLNITKKTILFWKTIFSNKTLYLGGDDLFLNCAGIAKNCWATHELNSNVNIENFDAVLFHGFRASYYDVPTTRLERQIYVFANHESPERSSIPYSRFDKNFFNLTMTYQLDSDILWNYSDIISTADGAIVAPRLGTVWNTRTRDATDLKNTKTVAIRSTWDESSMMKMRRKKTKTAIWFVSNCDPVSGREKYVKELAMHVDVDIYGKCGKEVRCPRNRDCFHELVEPDYYFYLSFENSMCQDYVTEKFFNALKYNVVPIVYGGANYSLFAPPTSYINALDFDSPRQLAIFLKILIAQPSEYDKYFEWKKSYMVVKPRDHVMCQLCQYLHDNSKKQSDSPLSAWFGSDQCPLQKKLKKLPYITRKDLKN